MDKTLRSRDIKIVHIGNSLGVRLPKVLLQKYGFTHSLVLEETTQGLLLRKKQDDKLSWADTYCMLVPEPTWMRGQISGVPQPARAPDRLPRP